MFVLSDRIFYRFVKFSNIYCYSFKLQFNLINVFNMFAFHVIICFLLSFSLTFFIINFTFFLFLV